VRTLWLFIAVLLIAGFLVAMFSGGSDAPRPATPPVQQPVPATVLAEELASASESREQADPGEADPAPATTTTQTDTTASNDGTFTDGLDLELPSVTIVPGDIRQLESGEFAIDDEFTLEGNGTRESPYEPSWDYLFSAADTYQPRLGEHEIPQRIAMLDDKWVRIAGYTAFPLIVGETSEMLVMLNKWDGCCIGVPPTPFDAVEVRLTSPVERGPKHQINYGTVTGRLKVDPYLIENWLVGLYILEESSLSNDL